MRLRDKVAIVTGGGRGIGAGIATMFAKEGAKVTLAARTEEQLQAVAAQISEQGGETLIVQTDVSKPAEVERMVARTVEHFGTLNVLVNNAGIGFHREFETAAVEDYDRVVDTNLKGMWVGCRYAVPEMKKAGGGAIISISSVHGVGGAERQSAYAASKGGIIAGTRALAVELAPDLIRLNVISPGAIRVHDPLTRIDRRLGPEYREEFLEKFGDSMEDWGRHYQPLSLVGMPEDIAYCAVYLASDESRFVTGANFIVDGGLTAALDPMGGVDPEKRAEGRKRWYEIRKWFQEKEERRA